MATANASRAGIGVALAAAVAIAWGWPRGGAAADAVGAEAPRIGPDLREQLDALGYAAWTEPETEAARVGIQRHDRERVTPGLNLYCATGTSEVRFMTLDGTLVHSVDWLGEETRIAKPASASWKCKTIAPTPDGRLAMVIRHTAVQKFGLDGAIAWRRHGRFHHDLDVLATGDIFVLGWQLRVDAPRFDGHDVADNPIGVLPPGGDPPRQLGSIAELVAAVPELMAHYRTAAYDVKSPDPRHEKRSPEPEAGRPGAPVRRRVESVTDAFHLNSLRVLRRDVTLSDGSRWPRGSILTCARNLDSILVVDPTVRRILWHWGIGELDRPHGPTLLENGNVLVFDNGWRRGWSRVVELDPGTGEIVWSYAGDPRESFFSRSRGHAERLPDGNTLVTDSNSGRAFEVTPAGEIVWEFFVPDVSPDGRSRRPIWRMVRLFEREVAALAWPEAVRPRLRAAGFTISRGGTGERLP